jgi:hypothetical protein
MNRRRLIMAALVVLVLFSGALLVSRRARRQVPLRYAHIPEETKEFFRGLERDGGDMVARFREEPLHERWRDETNEGEDAGNGFFKLEDEDFIVYYHNEGDGSAKANLILGCARRAVDRLADIFGMYFHPADANGRKLAFYVCRDRAEFNRLSTNRNPYAVAVTSMDFSPTGALCRGIYFAPETFDGPRWQSGDAESSLLVQHTVWHEMAHYVFFSSLDLSAPVSHPQWVTEGIADYAGDNTNRLREVDSSGVIPLSEFETGKYRGIWLREAYWIGYTAFLYMSEQYSPGGVRRFLQLSYRNPTRRSVEQATGVPFAQFDSGWQQSLRRR